ncbi:MAG: hypothetical protein K2J82_08145 [Muribaculaceae bacterium]|nr:hypothetical protein [Muribaculaceae bacterium]MDE6754567.1 hypothetical protein [Muribaculaceae bacterium]
MSKSIFSRMLASGVAFLLSSMMFAENYVAVEKQAKIFDEPNVKGYVTLNTKNQEVSPIPGMIFKSLESNNGWQLVEYSPGLRGYLSDQFIGLPSRLPSEGTYTVANNRNLKLIAHRTENGWTAEVNGLKYNGQVVDNAVIFFNSDNLPAFSLVDFGQGVIAISYDNNSTGFF